MFAVVTVVIAYLYDNDNEYLSGDEHPNYNRYPQLQPVPPATTSFL